VFLAILGAALTAAVVFAVGVFSAKYIFTQLLLLRFLGSEGRGGFPPNYTMIDLNIHTFDLGWRFFTLWRRTFFHEDHPLID